MLGSQALSSIVVRSSQGLKPLVDFVELTLVLESLRHDRHPLVDLYRNISRRFVSHLLSHTHSIPEHQDLPDLFRIILGVLEENIVLVLDAFVYGLVRDGLLQGAHLAEMT